MLLSFVARFSRFFGGSEEKDLPLAETRRKYKSQEKKLGCLNEWRLACFSASSCSPRENRLLDILGVRLGLIVGLNLVMTGCLEHNARIQPTPPESFQNVESDYPHASALIGDHYERDWKNVVHRRDVIAAELAVDVWSIHPYGERRVYRSRLATPLSWYQRFPLDFLLDLWPATVSIEVQDTCVLSPCRTHTPAELDAAAFAAGYAVTMPAEHTNTATTSSRIGN